MSVYTRKGDQGQTYLASGRKVYKNNVRVHLYGTLDELNSQIGFSISSLDIEKSTDIKKELSAQQHLLFDLGSELADFSKAKPSDGIIQQKDIDFLEKSIDRIEEKLGPMRNFILPGGSLASASLHLARTYCRRLERQMTKIIQEKNNQDEEGKLIIKDLTYHYINRLSDYFFMVARYANFLYGIKDVNWEKRD